MNDQRTRDWTIRFSEHEISHKSCTHDLNRVVRNATVVKYADLRRILNIGRNVPETLLLRYVMDDRWIYGGIKCNEKPLQSILSPDSAKAAIQLRNFFFQYLHHPTIRCVRFSQHLTSSVVFWDVTPCDLGTHITIYTASHSGRLWSWQLTVIHHISKFHVGINWRVRNHQIKYPVQSLSSKRPCQVHLQIREVPDSNTDRRRGYPDENYHGFPQTLQVPFSSTSCSHTSLTYAQDSHRYKTGSKITVL
jgi:hypothetical protein